MNILDLLPAEARREAGQRARQAVPRGAHAHWEPQAGRANPVDVLTAGDGARIPELLKVRYGRMRVDPFAFLRGSAAVMAADLGSLPDTGLRVQACGDCHLMNFGAFASPEGQAVFDSNDFDETLPAPFEWDVKRLAASLAVAGRARGLADKAARGLARRSVHAYRRHMLELAAVAPLDAWRSSIGLEAAVEDISERAVRKRVRAALNKAVEASRDAYRDIVSPDGTLRLPHRPLIMWRLDDHEDTAHAAFAAYGASLAEERRVLLDRYRLVDVAFKVVGVGSVGTFCAIGLFATADGDTLILQLKEAMPSVLARYAGASTYANQGERVVVGQRMMQAAPDVFLGWAAAGPQGRHFYVRALKDSRLANVGVDIQADSLAFYAGLCGRTLARAHARSGDAAEIAGYLGEGDAFDAAVAAFALAYAEQTTRDWRTFCEAIAAGRIEATEKPL